MIHITLKQLRYFDALAREQHFGRAAEACAVTQPALSMQIQELEQNLGVALVERTRAGLQLTPLGSEFAARAARILGDVRDLVDLAQRGGDVLSGKLHLGVIPSVAPYLLPPLLPIVRDAFPDLKLHVRETQTHVLVDELIEGKLDVILLALPITTHTDVTTKPLFDDKFLLATKKGQKPTDKVCVTPDQVDSEHLLLLEEGHCLRDQALTYCNLQQVDQISTYGASSLSTIVEMVAAGYGITLLPEICLPVELRGRDVEVIPFFEPEPKRTLGLAWRPTTPRAGDFEAFGKLVCLAKDHLHKSIGLSSAKRA